MSKPRTQEELDAQAKQEERLTHTYVQGASWGQNIRLPYQGVGHTYTRVCIGAKQNGTPVYEQVEI